MLLSEIHMIQILKKPTRNLWRLTLGMQARYVAASMVSDGHTDRNWKTDKPSTIITVEPLYNGHHWDKDFVLYSEVSFAQGVIVDHAPLAIVASYAGARIW